MTLTIPNPTFLIDKTEMITIRFSTVTLKTNWDNAFESTQHCQHQSLLRVYFRYLWILFLFILYQSNDLSVCSLHRKERVHKKYSRCEKWKPSIRMGRVGMNITILGYPFIQKIFLDDLLCARHWVSNRDTIVTGRTTSLTSCSSCSTGRDLHYTIVQMNINLTVLGVVREARVLSRSDNSLVLQS